MESQALLKTLVDADDSILVVIDVQESFLEKLKPTQSDLLVNRIDWLINVANRLTIPIIATAEDIPSHGSIAKKLAQRLPPNTPIYNKMVFNLADEAEIIRAVDNTGKGTCILVGLETDVCIAHSAIGLLQNGYKVAVVEDATGSPDSGHAYGIKRLQSAGVVLLSLKGLYYEWIRTVINAVELKKEFPDDLTSPQGITM